LDQAASLGSAALARFTYIERPKDIPLAALTALLTLLDLPVGLIRNPASHDQAVRDLQARSAALLEQLVATQAQVREGITCWNAAIIEGAERDEVGSRLGTYQRFLDGLRPINTAGKLKNFAATTEQVQAQGEAQMTLAVIQALEALVGELQPLTAYLLQARAVLPADDPVAAAILDLQHAQLAILRDPAQRSTAGAAAQLAQEARALKARYAAAYLERHQRARLTLDQDRRKAVLLNAPALKRLRALRGVSVLSVAALDEVERRLLALRACPSLSMPELATSPLCPRCNFRPLEEGDTPAAAQLETVARDLERLETDWTAALLQNLQDPTVKATLQLLDARDRQPLDRLLSGEPLPETIDGTLVRALQSAFEGLERVAVGKDELLAGLANGGAPSSVNELKERLNAFLTQLTRDKDPSRVRIVVE
ncbi:MAG: DUF6079 family protein, partial [Dehalococcoidia bacterium]